ncbi:MAG: hypothetical protein WA981_11145 [Glaciecola sp.]
MNNKLAILVHFVSASLVAIVCACLMHTQVVLHELRNIDVALTFQDYVYMSVQDLIGLIPTYGSVVTIGLGLSFICVVIIRKFPPFNHFFWYPIAGASAMYVIIQAMHPILEITFLASTRSTTGIVLQMLAGAIGGLAFVYLRQRYHLSNAV